MDYKKSGNTIIARIDRGEEVLEQIKNIALKENIKLASVSAIGAADYVEAGLYNVNEKQYFPYELRGELEIGSILGNITTKDGEFYLHLHVSCSDASGRGYGGHLKKCVISGTCEMFITVFEGTVERKYEDNTGLYVFDFSK